MGLASPVDPVIGEKAHALVDNASNSQCIGSLHCLQTRHFHDPPPLYDFFNVRAATRGDGTPPSPVASTPAPQMLLQILVPLSHTNLPKGKAHAQLPSTAEGFALG